jgi:hypothetical protein
MVISMDWKEMAKEHEGLHTARGFSRAMNIKKGTAIVYLHFLRKNGFVKTMRGKGGKRMYDISPLSLRKVGSRNYIDIINENSVMKLRERYEHRVYGKEPTIEEAIILALKSHNSRIILASLALFRKSIDWKYLYSLARKSRLERHVGALYDLSRKVFRVRRIDRRILRGMKQSPVSGRFLIGKRQSRDFPGIEKEWKVHIPFNRPDLIRLEA